MSKSKPNIGDKFPVISLPIVGGGTVELGRPQSEGAWQLVVVYRGKHCPLCRRYLASLESLKAVFQMANVETIIVSADTREKAVVQVEDDQLTYPCAYNLNPAQMRSMGLYVSEPRSEAETDRPYAEPGIFLVDEQGRLLVVDISNVPFARPDLNLIASGLGRMRTAGNELVLRGTL